VSRAAVAVAVLGVSFAFVSGASAATNPCGSLGVGVSDVRESRAVVRSLVPAATWRALEQGGYYVCVAARTRKGKLGIVSFRLPIGGVGQRVWFRLLVWPHAGVAARAVAARIRADPAACVAALEGPGDRSTRFGGVIAAGGFVVVTLSAVRRT
jgi:hypothetical protein